MHNYIIYEKATGRIKSTVSYENESDINLNELTSNSYIEGTLTLSELRNSYIKNGEIKTMPEKPSYLHEFDYNLEQWVEPLGYLATLITDFTAQVNQRASDVILGKYPIYKQLNNIGTDDYTPMNNWINSIRDLSNSANDTISSAQDTQEIEAIYQDYLTQLMEL